MRNFIPLGISSRNFDVVIVGAGPAGCKVASNLSKDHKILLVDKGEFPRDKPCGGMLVEESKEIVKQLGADVSIFSRPNRIGLVYVDWNNNIEKSTYRSFWNISRIAFDHWLLERAKKKCRFLPKITLEDFKVKENKIEVLLREDGQRRVITTKYLVDAEGAMSICRKKLLENDKIKRYVAVQEWLPLQETMKDATFIYDNEITDFYSWVIPKGEYVIIGSAIEQGNGNVKDRFQLFKDKVESRMGIQGKASKREAHLLSRPRTTDDVFIGSGNLMIVGEAAGLISPSTGEGISYAIRSGFFCAEIINEGLKNPAEEYKKLCNPLVKEIDEKLKKSGGMTSPKTRPMEIERLSTEID